MLQQYKVRGYLDENRWSQIRICFHVKLRQCFSMKTISSDDFDEGISNRTLREISILKSLQRNSHENVIKIHDVLVEAEGNFRIIFELVSSTLGKYLTSLGEDEHLSTQLLQTFSYQILSGIRHCHSNGIMHRSLCPHSIYLQNGKIKIGEFETARSFLPPIRPFTKTGFQLWYVAPEILLGVNAYSPVVDLWSIGCIIWEMIQKLPLFAEFHQIGQLYLIFQQLGTPTETTWPGITSSENWNVSFPVWESRRITHRLQYEPLISDLLSSLLVLNPQQRYNSIQALNHPYFATISTTPSQTETTTTTTTGATEEINVEDEEVDEEEEEEEDKEEESAKEEAEEVKEDEEEAETVEVETNLNSSSSSSSSPH